MAVDNPPLAHAWRALPAASSLPAGSGGRGKRLGRGQREGIPGCCTGPRREACSIPICEANSGIGCPPPAKRHSDGLVISPLRVAD